MVTDRKALEWNLEYERKRFVGYVEGVISSLREGADHLEREFRRVGSNFAPSPEYLGKGLFGPRDEYFREAHLGQGVVYTVMWMVANLNLDALLDASAKLKSIRDRLDWHEDMDEERERRLDE